MELIDKAKEWLEANKDTADGEAHGLVQSLVRDLELYKGLLEAEQEDCERQRQNKTAEWQRAERYLSVVRLANSQLKIGDIRRDSGIHRSLCDIASGR